MSLFSEDMFSLETFHFSNLAYEHTHLMNHQPSRFFWMTSTMTPLSKLTSSFPWLVYDWIVTYFSSGYKKSKGQTVRTVIVNGVDFTKECNPQIQFTSFRRDLGERGRMWPALNDLFSYQSILHNSTTVPYPCQTLMFFLPQASQVQAFRTTTQYLSPSREIPSPATLSETFLRRWNIHQQTATPLLHSAGLPSAGLSRMQ